MQFNTVYNDPELCEVEKIEELVGETGVKSGKMSRREKLCPGLSRMEPNGVADPTERGRFQVWRKWGTGYTYWSSVWHSFPENVTPSRSSAFPWGPQKAILLNLGKACPGQLREGCGIWPGGSSASTEWILSLYFPSYTWGCLSASPPSIGQCKGVTI